MYLIHDGKFVEIGVENVVRLSRSGVSKRFKRNIIPELERVYLLKAQ